MSATEQGILHLIRFADMSKWSANVSVFDGVKASYPLSQLSKVLKRIKEPIIIEDDCLYKRITVRLYGQGVLQRDEVLGKEIGTKRQFVAHAGQLIISRIDARNGAFGIVPEELEGAIVTNDFWLFDVHDALPQYLMLVMSSELFQKYWQTQSSGTTNRQRVGEDDFLQSKIALPSIEEQQALLDAYNASIQKADNTERLSAKEHINSELYLFDSLGIVPKASSKHNPILQTIHFVDTVQWGYDKNARCFPFGFKKYKPFSFAAKPSWIKDFYRGKSPKYSDKGSKFILNQKCNRVNEIVTDYAKTVDDEWLSSIPAGVLTRKGDILINSTGEGTLGRATCIAEDDHVGLAYDSHVLLLRVNEKEVDPQLLVAIINSSYGQAQVERYKSAQATKQTELGIENTKKFLFPLPSISEQRQIAAEIQKREIKAKALRGEAESLRQRAKKEFEEAVFGGV